MMKRLVALAVLLLAASVCKKPPVNLPPDTPAAPAGDTVGLVGTGYDFSATTADPEPDDIALRFAWGDGDTSDWSDWTLSRDTVTMVHSWPVPGSYEVRAQARDTADNLSGWSAPLTVAIGSHPPERPSAPVGPPDGARGEEQLFTGASTDPDGDSVAIRFDWGDGDTSDWSAYVTSGDSVTLSYAWQAFGTYRVAVQARDRTGVTSPWSASAVFDSRPPLLWKYKTGEEVMSSPAIAADGTVYFGSYDSYLYALNPDGSLKWRYRAGVDGVPASPAVAPDGTVYIGAYDSRFFAFNPDGSARWVYATGSNSTAPAIAADGTVYFGSDDHCLSALDPDGSLIWLHETDGRVRSSPAIAADGTIYVGSDDGYVYALNPDSSLEWRYSAGVTGKKTHVQSSPAVGPDGTVYVGSDNDIVHAINPDSSSKWWYETGANVESSPAVGPDGTVYVGSDDDHLYAFNPDGSVKWSYETSGNVESSPAIAADGTIYVGSNDDRLYAISADGTLKWRCRTGAALRSSPAIAPDGTVYFGSSDSCLYAIRGESPLANSPWPKFRHDSRNTGRVGGGW